MLSAVMDDCGAVILPGYRTGKGRDIFLWSLSAVHPPFVHLNLGPFWILQGSLAPDMLSNDKYWQINIFRAHLCLFNSSFVQMQVSICLAEISGCMDSVLQMVQGAVNSPTSHITSSWSAWCLTSKPWHSSTYKTSAWSTLVLPGNNFSNGKSYTDEPSLELSS